MSNYNNDLVLQEHKLCENWNFAQTAWTNNWNVPC